MSRSIHPDAETELGDGDAANLLRNAHQSRHSKAVLAEYERVRDLIVVPGWLDKNQVDLQKPDEMCIPSATFGTVIQRHSRYEASGPGFCNPGPYSSELQYFSVSSIYRLIQ